MILLWDIGIIILASTILAYLARIFKQPMILAYVLAGIIIGPFGLQLITSKEIITALAELGIAFLLFIVGLELDVRRLKDVGRVSIGCGLGQIIITLAFGYLLANALGFKGIEAFYIAFALTISSTMVVIKLLSDKNELDTLHGRISLGILLVQDVVTIMFLASLTTLDNLSFFPLLDSLINGLALFLIAIISSRYVLPVLLRFSARSIELLFLTALSWCFVFAAISLFFGFSIAIGSFLAGVTLASFPYKFPYNLEIIGRVRSLRDFFATIFFVSLGMQIPLALPLIEPTIVLSLFVLIGNALIMMVIVRLFGYGKRTAFLTALSVAQISEFSLIIANQGLLLGHISHETFSLITFIAVVTITISSYFIMHGRKLYLMFLPALEILDRISMGRELADIPQKSEKHIIVFGCHRMGYTIVKTLRKLKKNFLVVDYNPDIIKFLMAQGTPCIYGDLGDREILERVDLTDAEIVISTIPNVEDNLMLIEETRRHNPGALIFITANYPDQALELYDAGADYVILPRLLGGEKVSEFLEEYLEDKDTLLKMRDSHMTQLEVIKNEELLNRYDLSFLGFLEKKINSHRRI